MRLIINTKAAQNFRTKPILNYYHHTLQRFYRTSRRVFDLTVDFSVWPVDTCTATFLSNGFIVATEDGRITSIRLNDCVCDGFAYVTYVFAGFSDVSFSFPLSRFDSFIIRTPWELLGSIPVEPDGRAVSFITHKTVHPSARNYALAGRGVPTSVRKTATNNRYDISDGRSKKNNGQCEFSPPHYRRCNV